MTAKFKEQMQMINSFINNFDGELVIKTDGIYHNGKLVARYKDGVSHIYIEKLN